MARVVGINVNRLFTITFVIGSALAGLGGAVGAGILAIEPTYAMKYMTLFIIIVVVGGEGSFKGSFVAAMAIGIADTVGKYLLPQAAPYIVYVIVFVLLLMRPNGILNGRSA
jgi:branched-chain amino acid transport system permease protein